MTTPVFPTTLSIPFHNVDKYVGLRTYQYALVVAVLGGGWYFGNNAQGDYESCYYSEC